MLKGIHKQIVSRIEKAGYLSPCTAEDLEIALGNESNHTRALESIRVIRKIWNNYPGLGVCPVLAQVYKDEQSHSYYPQYRDHIVHTLEVYLLGLDLFIGLPDLCKKIFENISYDKNDYSLNDFKKKVWTVTALSHDQGYVMEVEKRSSIPKDIELLLEDPISDLDWISSGTRKDISRKIRKKIGAPPEYIDDLILIEEDDKEIDLLSEISQHMGSRVGFGKGSLRDYYELSKAENNRVWDHGLTSMLLLQQLYRRLKYTIDILIPNISKVKLITQEEQSKLKSLKSNLDKSQKIIDEASLAVALHNIRNIKEEWGRDLKERALRKGIDLDRFSLSFNDIPLAWFLIFCDTIQIWNRTLAKAGPYTKDIFQSPENVSIVYNNGKVWMHFLDEYEHQRETGKTLFTNLRLELIKVLKKEEVDEYLKQGPLPRNEMQALKSENVELRDQIEAIKNTEIELQKKNRKNSPYLGIIDLPDLDVIKLERKIKSQPRMYPDHKPVFVLYTGGTVGMVRLDPDDPRSPLKTMSLDRVLPNLKRISELKFDIHFWELEQPLDSSNIGNEEWMKIADIIQKVYSHYQGFVILHGTDTMAYTASALSFIFKNLAKPVILTGAEKPISEPVSDAEPNIVNSVQIAAPSVSSIPLVPEVCIFFGTKLIRGNRTKKVHSLSLQGFDSPNCDPLGNVEDKIDINQKVLIVEGKRENLNIVRCLDSGVAIFEVYPNQKICVSTLEHILKSENIRGLILKTYGTGNAPTIPEKYLDLIKKAIENRKVIVNLTNCPKGQVQVRLFETNARLFEYGVINGGDMTTEAAMCKLMWLIGDYNLKDGEALTQKQYELIKERMQVNYVGELRFSAYNLREDNVYIKNSEPFKGDYQKLQYFDQTLINHAYIRAQGISLDTKKHCKIKLEFYYSCPWLSIDFREDKRQKFHLIDTIERKWENQIDGITFNFDATPIIKKVAENERDLYHSLQVITDCEYNVHIKTLELAIFTENIRGIRNLVKY